MGRRGCLDCEEGAVARFVALPDCLLRNLWKRGEGRSYVGEGDIMRRGRGGRPLKGASELSSDQIATMVYRFEQITEKQLVESRMPIFRFRPAPCLSM